MTLSREINRLLAGFLGIFMVVALSAAYWAVVGPDTILRREDNPRLVVAEAAIRRGSIVDRKDEPLAASIVGADNQVTRQYPHPEASSLIGYSSLRYGVGGSEAAFNTTLRGDDLPADIAGDILADILHRPQVGSNIQLTLDLGVQQAMMQAMNGQVGAAVVLSVPDGEVLGLLSLPTYDPNTLDLEWDALAAAPQKPFFNRVLQGQYQPGGTLQTPLMAAAVVNDGNAPEPYVLMATRAPDAADWKPIQQNRPTVPYMTERTARQLQDLMRNTVANGAALNAARPGIDIGGHSALAYSGTEIQSWFIGFATLPGGRGVAVAVVLENSDDPGLAADIGGAILSAAHQSLNES